MAAAANNPRLRALMGVREYGRQGVADELRGLLPEEEPVVEEELPIEDVPGVEDPEALALEDPGLDPGLSAELDLENLTPEQIAEIEALIAAEEDEEVIA